MSLLIALMIAQAGTAAAVECKNPMTQRDMNVCSDRDFQAADRQLNSQWSRTTAQMRDLDEEPRANGDRRTGYFDQLLAAQRLWIGFRDAHCASEGYKARGGSMEPMLVSGCKATLTRARTMQLRELADGLEG